MNWKNDNQAAQTYDMIYSFFHVSSILEKMEKLIKKYNVVVKVLSTELSKLTTALDGWSTKFWMDEVQIMTSHGKDFAHHAHHHTSNQSRGKPRAVGKGVEDMATVGGGLKVSNQS
jgi:hypothetical protein